jgi:hypothetical protein
MTARPDLERVVTDWLNDDAGSAGSDRVLAAALVRIASTGQERVPRLPRFLDMHVYAKLAIGAAAVLVAVVIGINLLPASGGVAGLPAASPSPSTTPSPSPSRSPLPTPTAPAELPPDGPLAAGTYPMAFEGVPGSFTLASSGWRSNGGWLDTGPEGTYEQPDTAGLRFWGSAPENVYADPCAHTPLDPVPLVSPPALAAAVAGMPGIDVVTEPTAVTIDGRSGQYVAFTIRDDIDCPAHDFYLWYDDSTGGPSGGWVWASAVGSLHRVWIVDLGGAVAWIDSETFEGAKPELDQEIQSIVESIQLD